MWRQSYVAALFSAILTKASRANLHNFHQAGVASELSERALQIQRAELRAAELEASYRALGEAAKAAAAEAEAELERLRSALAERRRTPEGVRAEQLEAELGAERAALAEAKAVADGLAEQLAQAQRDLAAEQAVAGHLAEQLGAAAQSSGGSSSAEEAAQHAAALAQLENRLSESEEREAFLRMQLAQAEVRRESGAPLTHG